MRGGLQAGLDSAQSGNVRSRLVGNFGLFVRNNRTPRTP